MKRKNSMRKWIFLGILALTTIFCSVSVDPGSATPDVAAIVNATLTAAAGTVITPTPTETPAPLPVGPTATETLSTTPMSSFPDMGTITGTLMYPAEGIPPLRIAAFEVTTGEVSYTDTAANQSTYTFDLPVGTYHVVAYSIGGGGFPTGLAGGYSQFVPCGLSVDCTDHSLINVTVTAGATASGVDPGDWYAPDGSFPPMPTP
jgi:hypothetical protein